MTYSKQKFLAQPLQRQHKYAAKLLRSAFREGGNLAEYHHLCEWLQLSPLVRCSQEEIANRFHYHQQFCDQGLHEADLLVTTKDRPSEVPYLPITIYLDNLRSAHNVGSIVRTTEAFRLGSIVCGGSTPPLDHPQVIKTAMGCAEHVSWAKERRTTTPMIALETSSGAPHIADFLFPSSFTLIIGNEEYGVSHQLLGQCDAIVQIPLVGTKNSLNVANAFAIAAAQIRCQQIR